MTNEPRAMSDQQRAERIARLTIDQWFKDYMGTYGRLSVRERDGLVAHFTTALIARPEPPAATGHAPHQHHERFKAGVRAAIAWLHNRAWKMTDPVCRAHLNSAATNLGWDLSRNQGRLELAALTICPESQADPVCKESLRTAEPPSVGIIDAATCEHVWRIWPETDGKSQRCTRCGDWRDTSQAATGPSLQDEADRRAVEREVLLFASYCGDDNPNCTDAKPCPTCLGMSNVYRARLLRYERQLAPEWNVDLPNTDGSRAAMGQVTGEMEALRSANVARQNEWVSPGAREPLSLSFRGNELAGEVGEACNILKKLDRERLGLIGSRATVEQLAEELADVVICADLTAMDTGIDLWAAVIAKFNATSEKRGLATRLSLSRAPAQAPAVPEELRKLWDTMARESDEHTALYHYLRGKFEPACARWVRSLLADAAKNREGGQHG